MKFRLHPLVLLVAVLVLCGGLIVGIAFLRSRATSTTKNLLAHLPRGDAVVLYIDFQTLRRLGVLAALAGSRVAEEPEYKAFVLETGFDYQQDLDLALVSFHKDVVYFLLRGRFDWRKLSSYVTSQDGVCRNAFCRVGGSTPKRNISFFPLRHDLMAMAVSADSWAASNLMSRKPDAPQLDAPSRPVWLYAPAAFLRNNDSLPAGTRLFAKAMEGAEKIMLSLSQENGRLEAHLEVTCRTPDDASVLSFQLEGVTRLLRGMIASQDQAPNPRDLSGVLAAGTFRHENLRVIGRWPLEQAFLESLAGGSE